MNWTINYSLVENPGSTTIVGTGNIVGIDPMLGPLQDNGGPTFTHAPSSGSPAIDAGDPSLIGLPPYDQRGVGFARVNGGRVDMGSVEAPSFVVTTELDVVASDGLTSLREAIANANSSAGADEITFSALLTGETILLTQGLLTINSDVTITGLGADLLTIDASGNDPTPDVNNNDGSGIFSASLTVSGLTLTCADGAPVVRGRSVLRSCKVTGNHGTFAILESYDGYIEDCEITGNSAFAIVSSDGPYGFLEISGTTISNNNGKAVMLPSAGSLDITDSTISGNVADKGAGIFLGTDSGSAYYGTSGSAASATITNSIISGNTATNGSAIYGRASFVTLIDCTVSGNLVPAP